MEIRWYGQSFFEITTDTEIKKGVKVYLDPYGAGIGLTPPSGLTADLVTVSHQHPDHNNLEVFSDQGIVIDTPGEYSVSGLDIKGILSYHDAKLGEEWGSNVIYLFSSEDIRVLRHSGTGKKDHLDLQPRSILHVQQAAGTRGRRGSGPHSAALASAPAAQD